MRDHYRQGDILLIVDADLDQFDRPRELWRLYLDDDEALVMVRVTNSTAEPNAQAAATETAGTEYIVCRLIDATNLERIGTATAKTTGAAIRDVVASEPGDGSGRYIAIPARSWKPVKVTPQTVTTFPFFVTDETKREGRR